MNAGILLPHAGGNSIEYLASQLPDGYVLDEHNHVIRTDPGLPDHFYGLFGNEGGVGDLAGGWESTKSEEGPSIIGCWKTTSEAGGPLWRLILRA